MKFSIIKRENKSTGWKSNNYYVRFYENGKLKYIDTEESNKISAEKKAKKIISEIPKKQKVTESSIKNLTLKQYLINNKWFSKTENPLYKEFIIDKTSNHSFQEGTSNYLTINLKKIFFKYNDEIGNCIYYNIQMDDTNKFKERLAKLKNVTASTKNSYISALRSVYSYLIRKDKYIKFNPFNNQKIEFFRTNYKKKYVFKPYEIYYLFNKELLEKIEPVYFSKEQWIRFLDSDFFLAYKFAAYTGMRTNEITALVSSQISYERIVTINRAFKDGKGSVIRLPKTNRPRQIVLCDAAYSCIAEKLQIRKPNEFIFQTRLGTHLYNRYSRNWPNFRNEILNAFDMDIGNYKFSPHGLRKSLNTNLLKYSDIKESVIRFYCGWSESKNTLTPVQEGHYTGYNETDLNDVAKAIQKMYVINTENLLSSFDEIKAKKNSKGWTPPKEDELKLDFLKKVYKLKGNDLKKEIKTIKLLKQENITIERKVQHELEILRKKENELNFISLLTKVKVYLINQKAIDDKLSNNENELLNKIVELLSRTEITKIDNLAFLDYEIKDILEEKTVNQLVDYYNDINKLVTKINDNM